MKYLLTVSCSIVDPGMGIHIDTITENDIEIISKLSCLKASERHLFIKVGCLNVRLVRNPLGNVKWRRQSERRIPLYQLKTYLKNSKKMMISKIIFNIFTTDGKWHYGCIYINLLTGIVQIFKSDDKDLKDYRICENQKLFESYRVHCE